MRAAWDRLELEVSQVIRARFRPRGPVEGHVLASFRLAGRIPGFLAVSSGHHPPLRARTARYQQ